MTEEELTQHLLASFHAVQELLMTEARPRLWGQPEKQGKLALLGIIAGLELLCLELRLAAARDLSVPSEMVNEAIKICSSHRMEFNFKVKPRPPNQDDLN